MEKETFYSYLDSSEKKSQEACAFLQSIINKYPYFDSARVLYLINLKVAEPLLFEEQLFKNAALLPDRRQLFFAINPLNQSKSEITALNKNASKPDFKESDSTFLLIEDTQNTSGSLVDISEPTKENEIPISGYELLEINDQDNANGISGESSNADEDYNIDKRSLSNDDLIEQFIKSSPKLKPPQMIQGEQEDISLKSLEEPEDLISEPLANIYLSQGFTEKAISVYEKLSLKYPEKSSYFAGQIQKIKKQSNI